MLFFVAVLAGHADLAAAPSSNQGEHAQQAPRLGQPVPAAAADAASLQVFPDGHGLPPGGGRAVEGLALYVQHCASCHGAQGRGASAEELAGGAEPLTSAYPDRTVGLYWPYATTLFDLIRRAKPMQAPGSFTADELYALTAYVLFANGLLAEDARVDASTLPAVRMPNHDGFIGVDATTSLGKGAKGRARPDAATPHGVRR
jgi:mono/diheme cytochrome c family protein